MSTHPEASDNEIFVGNTTSTAVPEYLVALKTVRLGDQAYDLDGKKISKDYMRPLIIGRAEAGQYDRIMMRRTFGEKYR